MGYPVFEKAQSRVLNIAHRGARSIAPENTLAAARKAVECHAHMWELDVAMTADDQLVIVHDAALLRTSNAKERFPERRPWRVFDLTLEELRSLDFGSWFLRRDPFGCIAAGEVSAEELAAYAGEPAPSLESALRFTKEHDWLVNVEIKDLTGAPGDSRVVEKTVSMIREMEMAESVVISSFNHAYLVRSRRAAPEIAVGALVGWLHRDPLALMSELGAQSYHPRADRIRPEEIALLRREGFEVLTWVANEEKDMRALIAAGVSGIFTDFPQRLHRVITG